MVTWLELLSAVVYYLNFIAHSRLLWTHCIEVLYYLSALALCYSAAEYCAPVWSRSAHTSRGRCAVELYHASHLWHPPFYTSPMASSALQHWTTSPTNEGWWRKSLNIIVGQSSLISLIHHCYDSHPESRCGWTSNQLTSKVDGGITGSRLRWSTLT